MDSINDLGVTFDNNLSFKDHTSQKINKAYSILGIIKRNFIYMDALQSTRTQSQLVPSQLVPESSRTHGQLVPKYKRNAK